MSTSIEAAAAATIIQLLSNDYGVDVRWSFSGARWRAAILQGGTAWRGSNDQVLSAFVEASCNAEENVGAVLATLHAVELTTELGDAWRLLAAIASEFDFVALSSVERTDDAPHVIKLAANAHELGRVEVFWTLPEGERERLTGAGFLAALVKLDETCQSAQQTTEPAPELRGNEVAPVAGTIEA